MALTVQPSHPIQGARPVPHPGQEGAADDMHSGESPTPHHFPVWPQPGGPLREGTWASIEEAPGREPQQEPGDRLSLRHGCRCLSWVRA